MLRADLHTHTVASGHGYSTFTENASYAASAGMELIAVTDHGPRVPEGAHEWYFYNQKMTPSVFRGMRVLHGCEANIVPDTDNGLDLPDELLEVLDFVSVGLHQLCGMDGGDIDANTHAVVRAISNPLVDMLTHPGNDVAFPVRIIPIIEAAVQHNVIIELNNHSFDSHGSRIGTSDREVEFALAAYEAGLPVAIGSDAHYWSAIGQNQPALAAALQVGIPPDYFLNLSAERVVGHLTAKRPRPRMDWGPTV